MINKFFDNILVPIFDVWEKIWRNPWTECDKCQAYMYSAQNVGQGYYDKGFNKWHYINAHEKGNNKVATATATKFVPGQWYWHVHHEKLVEQLTEPVENRISYIKADKGAQVATRLHFMRPVKNPPVAATNPKQKAYDAVKRAHDNYTVSDEVLAAAKREYEAANPVFSTPTQAQWEALHKQECYSYCPWNGKTLFPPRANGIA